MWYRGARYRHRSCLDLDVEVVKVMYRDAKRVKLKIAFVRQRDGLTLGFPPQRVEIQKSDFGNWEMVRYELVDGVLVGNAW